MKPLEIEILAEEQGYPALTLYIEDEKVTICGHEEIDMTWEDARRMAGKILFYTVPRFNEPTEINETTQ